MNDIQLAERYLRKHRDAEQRGIEFSLSFTSYKNLRRAKKCFYTGKALTNENFSVDRIDAAKGYVAGNCVACDNEFNQKKGGLSLDELRSLYNTLTKKGLI